jgi:hypothetical protein
MKFLQVSYTAMALAAIWVAFILSWLSWADSAFWFEVILWIILAGGLVYFAFAKSSFEWLVNMRNRFTFAQSLLSVVVFALPLVFLLNSAINAKQKFGSLMLTKLENEWLYYLAYEGAIAILAVTFIALLFMELQNKKTKTNQIS